MRSMKVYSISQPRFIFTLIMTAAACYFPILSIIEIATTGAIDFDAVGRSRRETPMWQLYIMGWTFGAFLLYNYLVPILFLYFKRFQIIISETHISTKDISICKNDIESISKIGWKNDRKINSTSEQYILVSSLFGNRNLNEIENMIQKIINDRTRDDK